MIDILRFDDWDPTAEWMFEQARTTQSVNQSAERQRKREARRNWGNQWWTGGGCCMTTDELQSVLGEHYAAWSNLTAMSKARVFVVLKNLGYSLDELREARTLPPETVQRLVTQFS